MHWLITAKRAVVLEAKCVVEVAARLSVRGECLGCCVEASTHPGARGFYHALTYLWTHR